MNNLTGKFRKIADQVVTGSKSKVAAIGAGMMVFSSGAFADPTLTAPTYDTSNVVVIAGALLTGIAVIWGIRQAISLGRR